MTQQHGLTWGALDFVSETPTDAGWLIEAVAEGASFGNPEPVVEIVQSLLTDGALAVTQRWDNREITMKLRLSGVDGDAIAAAEAALMAEVLATEKSPLVWTPPTDNAAVTVFDVVNARLDRDYEGWDDDEVLQENRYFLLTLTCLPFARTEEKTVVPALSSGSATVTVIDACTSFTNWTASFLGLTATSSGSTGGYVYGQGTKASSAAIALSRNFPTPASMGGDTYLRITVQASHAGTYSAYYEAHSTSGQYPLTLAATRTSSIAGAVDHYYYAPVVGGGTFTNLLVYIEIPSGGSATAFLRVHEVARTSSIPAGRQQSRTASVGGSAPTQAAIRVYDSSALGADVLVYTSRNTAWQVAMRTYRTMSATVTADTAMVSGARNDLSTPMHFEIPADVFTRGTYALVARMNVTAAATLPWTVGGIAASGASFFSVKQAGSASLSTTSGYQIIPLGTVTLPTLDVEGDQRVKVEFVTATASITVDEVWLFSLDDGALTWVKNPYHGVESLTWVEIRSPELGAARPSVWGGKLTNRSDGVCIDLFCESFGSHRFSPGEMQIFTVCTSTETAKSEIEFYPRYHSHVQDD